MIIWATRMVNPIILSQQRVSKGSGESLAVELGVPWDRYYYHLVLLLTSGTAVCSAGLSKEPLLSHAWPVIALDSPYEELRLSRIGEANSWGNIGKILVLLCFEANSCKSDQIRIKIISIDNIHVGNTYGWYFCRANKNILHFLAKGLQSWQCLCYLVVLVTTW